MLLWNTMEKLSGSLVAAFAPITLFLALTQSTEGVDMGEWKRNVLIKDMEKLANLHNKTDCWICMHMPTHKTSGLPMVAVPLPESDWYTRQCYGCSGTWSYSWKKSNIKTLHLGSRFQETAGICWTHNETVGNMIYLGTYPFCNKTIVIRNGTRFYPADMKTKNLTYFVHNISHFDITALMTNNGCPVIPATCCPMTTDTPAKCGDGNSPAATYLTMLVESFTKLIYADSSSVGHLLGANLWLLCGRTAYDRMPARWKGVCTFGRVIPSHTISKSLGNARIRNARSTAEVEPVLTHNYWTPIARGIIPPLGIMMNHRDLHRLNNWTIAMFNDTIEALKLIQKEQSQIRDFVLQTRYAVDSTLAAQGGVCALIHSHCCMYISDFSPNITHTILHMESVAAENPLLQTEGFSLAGFWNALWSWLPDGSWIGFVLKGLVICFFMSIILCCFIQCFPSLVATLKNCKTSSCTASKSEEALYVSKKVPPVLY